MLMSSHPSCSCLIGGDFNVELDCNDNISMLVNNFNCKNKLLRCDVVFPVADRLTYYNESLQCGSAIDYFLTSNLKDTIAFTILDLDVNLSDHRPIMAVCVYCDNTCKPVSTTGGCGHPRTERLRCDHAPIDKYYAQTHFLLQQLFIPKRKCNFYKFWWSLELDTLKEKAIESCRMWKNTGSPKFGPIYTQYKKTNYYIKSVFAKSRLLRPVILRKTYMKLYCANLVKSFERFGNQSSPMLLPILFRFTALLTAPL